ncbi:hypothetical protein FRC08_007921 [Ceratobasidium sp. 394]|nr:hypothetical protein FRC08_007921 [Ceratobasidium sp. 394]
MYSNPRGENSQGPRRAANILRGGSKEQTPGPRAETNPYGSDPRVSHRPSKSVRFATVDAPVAPEETNQEVHPRGGVLSTVVNITSDTPLPAVVRYLATHSSIADLTDELSHFPAVSMHPVTSTALSDIYRATRSDGTRLAIKCLRQSDPKHAKHTARELNTWSKLKHPNILELHGGAVFQGCLAMVSPWMPYGGVRSMIQKWPNTDRYKLCYQLASAVQYLHEENVVHGDIKGAST